MKKLLNILKTLMMVKGKSGIGTFKPLPKIKIKNIIIIDDYNIKATIVNDTY